MADEASFILKLIDKFSGNARKVTGAASGMERQLSRMEKGTRGAGQGLAMVGAAASRSGGIMDVAFGSIAARGIEIAATKVYELGRGIAGLVVGTADFAQRTSIGFQAVAKHGASAEKLFAHSRALAEELGLDVQKTSGHMVKLLALQFNPKMATDLVKMGADMQALGAGGEDVDRILNQIGQIKAKGRLQQEELTVLAENKLAPELVFQDLEKTLGKTRSEIMKMLGSGQITSDMALPAILNAVKAKTGESELGQRGKEMAERTIGGMSGKLKAQWQNMWIDVAREGTPAIMNALAPLGAEISGLLKSPAVREGLVSGIEAVGNVVREAIPFIKAFVGGLVDGFRAVWPAVQQVLGVLSSGFGSNATWLDTAKQYGAVLGKIWAVGIGVAAVIGGVLLGAIWLVTGAVNLWIGAWSGIFGVIGTVTSAIGGFISGAAQKLAGWVSSAYTVSTDFVMGLVNGIGDGAQWVVDAVKNLGSSVLAAFDKFFKFGSPSKLMKQRGGWTTEGLELGMVAKIGGVERAGVETGNAFANGLRAHLDAVGSQRFTDVQMDPRLMGPSADSLMRGGVEPVSAAGGAPRIVFAPKVTIQVPPGALGEGEREQLGDRIVDAAEDVFYSMIERLSLEAGLPVS